MTEEKFFEPVEAFEQKLKGDKEFLVQMATTLSVFASLIDPVSQAKAWVENVELSGGEAVRSDALLSRQGRKEQDGQGHWRETNR